MRNRNPRNPGAASAAMAGLVPAIHVVGRQYFRRLSRLGKRHGKMVANLFHFLDWTTWMAGTSPAMTAPIDSAPFDPELNISSIVYFRKHFLI